MGVESVWLKVDYFIRLVSLLSPSVRLLDRSLGLRPARYRPVLLEAFIQVLVDFLSLWLLLREGGRISARVSIIHVKSLFFEDFVWKTAISFRDRDYWLAEAGVRLKNTFILEESFENSSESLKIELKIVENVWKIGNVFSSHSALFAINWNVCICNQNLCIILSEFLIISQIAR
jgi:hypothetical protein